MNKEKKLRCKCGELLCFVPELVPEYHTKGIKCKCGETVGPFTGQVVKDALTDHQEWWCAHRFCLAHQIFECFRLSMNLKSDFSKYAELKKLAEISLCAAERCMCAEASTRLDEFVSDDQFLFEQVIPEDMIDNPHIDVNPPIDNKGENNGS